MALEVLDNPRRSRYELRDDGHLLGFTEYAERDGAHVRRCDIGGAAGRLACRSKGCQHPFPGSPLLPSC